jgi:L-ascorbate metabolism protein UlaG (beta-lactamase superfamily)
VPFDCFVSFVVPDGVQASGYNRLVQRLAITWLGHSTFLLRTPGSRRLLIDPWLAGNPSCPAAFRKPPKVDLVLVSHGHFDHMDDLLLSRARAVPW